MLICGLGVISCFLGDGEGVAPCGRGVVPTVFMVVRLLEQPVCRVEENIALLRLGLLTDRVPLAVEVESELAHFRTPS